MSLVVAKASGKDFASFLRERIFVPLGMTRTVAELAPEEKDRISHRGVAFRALLPAVVQLLSDPRVPGE